MFQISELILQRKFAVTGHTDGIGKRLFELLPNAIGFSRATGHDISTLDGRRKLLDCAQHSDVLINNSCPLHGFGQTVLFLEWVHLFKDDPNKIIINVGSNIANPGVILGRNRHDTLYYQAQKICLKEMTDRVRSTVKCKILYKSFGYVGTQKIIEKLSKNFPNTPYISVDEACSIILEDFIS